MSYPRQIRNFNAFLDGVSYFGRATEGDLPEVKINRAGYRGAGMDGPVGVDMGLEAMRARLTLAEWDPAALKLLGRVNRMVLRPAAMGEGDGQADTIIASIGGLFATSEPGTLKPGSEAPLKLEVDVRAYRLEINGEVIFDIDLETGKRVIGGVDQTAEIRRAMGL